MRNLLPACLVRIGVLTRAALLCGIVSELAGCATHQAFLVEPPPYMVLPVDEMMSCDALAASFRYAARRAALLEFWLSVGPPAGYGYERFPKDAPKELVDERRRLDALADQQRYKGCVVMEPGPAVVLERSKLEGTMIRPQPPVVLKTRG